MDFHRRWGHLNFEECCKQLGMSINASKKLVCEECELSKIRVKNVSKVASSRSDQPIYRLHVDLSGRKLSTLDGKRYYLLITDDFSRYR